MIDLLRNRIDILYKWKGVFQLLGKYKLTWTSGESTYEDVTTILRGLCVKAS